MKIERNYITRWNPLGYNYSISTGDTSFILYIALSILLNMQKTNFGCPWSRGVFRILEERRQNSMHANLRCSPAGLLLEVGKS